MSSRALSFAPFVAGLEHAANRFKIPDHWQATSPDQEIGLTFATEFCQDSQGGVFFPGLRSAVFTDSTAIHDFFGTTDEYKRLAQFSPGSFGIASELKITLPLLVEGEAWPFYITRDRISHDFFLLESARGQVEVLRTALSPHPCFMVALTSGDRLLITKSVPTLDGLDEFSLFRRISDVLKTLRASQAYGGVIMPMFEFGYVESLDWALGLYGKARSWRQRKYCLVEALQYINWSFGLRRDSQPGLNENEFHSGQEMYVMDGPFLAILLRQGAMPYVIGLIEEDAWRRPANLW